MPEISALTRLPDKDVADFWIKAQQKIGRSTKVDVQGHETLLKMWRQRIRVSSHKIAFECLGQSLTFAEIDMLSDQVAAGLLSRSFLNRGDRIAIMLPNLSQYLIIVLAIHKAGMVVVNCNPLYTRKEIEFQLNDSGAKLLFIITNVAKEPAEASVPSLKEVILTELGDMLPLGKRQLVNFVVHYVKKMVPKFRFAASIQVRSFRSLLQKPSAAMLQRLRALEGTVKADDIAFLQYTGGTTGTSKGAVLTHAAITYNMLQSKAGFSKTMLQKAIDLLHVPGPKNVMCLHPLPFYHIYGLMCCLLTASASGSGTVTLPNPRDRDALFKLLARRDLIMLTGLNTLFKNLLTDPRIEKLELPADFSVVAGGMATSPDVSLQWFEKTGTRIGEGYGLTEASPMLALVDPLDPRSGVGGIALPETLIKLRDEFGHDLPLGQGPEVRGEVLAKGPQLMTGYYQNPAETALVMSDDGFLHTGDIATIGPDGLIEIVDRKKDMIDVSGFSVYPSEVELRAMETGVLLECAAIGRPDPRTGERVVLYAVPLDSNLREDSLMLLLSLSLTNYKRPSKIVFVESLPKSPVGKILRRQVKEFVKDLESSASTKNAS